jgi:hypothetical protein
MLKKNFGCRQPTPQAGFALLRLGPGNIRKRS